MEIPIAIVFIVMSFLGGIIIGDAKGSKREKDIKGCREIIETPDGNIILEQGDRVWLPPKKGFDSSEEDGSK